MREEGVNRGRMLIVGLAVRLFDGGVYVGMYGGCNLI